MKKEKINKKLVLNKETISKLNTKELNKIKGGMHTELIDAMAGEVYLTK